MYFLIPIYLKLYCLYCKDEINHAEVREIGGYSKEDFKKEFELGRFVNGNRIPINELLECSYKSCFFNVNGKCWNSNGSNKCSHRIKEVNVNE